MQILIVNSDTSLREEFEAALENTKDLNFSILEALSPHQGIEIARIRNPDLVCIAMDSSGRELEQFAQELRLHSPNTTICAAYRVEAISPGFSESSAIISGVRAGVSDFLRRPLSSQEVGQLIDRVSHQGLIPTSTERGFVVSISSTKGGVGKSTVAVNTACNLAKQAPGKVLLIDGSLQLGVCAGMLDLEPSTTIADAVQELERLDPTLLRELTLHHSSGLHLLAAPKSPLASTEITDEAIARILTIARKAYDYIVVDTFPLLESVVLTILDLSDLAYLVFQGTVPCVLGHLAYLQSLNDIGIDPSRQRIVLNRNHAGFSGELSASDITTKLKRKIDHLIPYQKRILTSMNSGEPYVLQSGKIFGFGKALKRIADEIINKRNELNRKSRAQKSSDSEKINSKRLGNTTLNEGSSGLDGPVTELKTPEVKP